MALGKKRLRWLPEKTDAKKRRPSYVLLEKKKNHFKYKQVGKLKVRGKKQLTMLTQK